MLLLPFVTRYRGRITLAFAALLIAALATLAVPVAVRRMIDFGFSAEHIGLIDQYFSVMLAVAAVLAAASATRYYLVTTLGERVVADLRAAVFDHITGLSAAFFDKARIGELISRLAADTTQIKAAVGVSVSTALRNVVLFVGSAAMMVVTSPRLSSFVLAAIPVIVLPLVALRTDGAPRARARRRTRWRMLPPTPPNCIGAVRTLQAYTNEPLASARFGAAVETCLSGRGLLDPRARAADRGHHLSRVR